MKIILAIILLGIYCHEVNIVSAETTPGGMTSTTDASTQTVITNDTGNNTGSSLSATDDSTTLSTTDEFTSTTVSATDEFTSTTVSATDEFTSTTVSATDEFTSTTVSATDEFTSTTVSATDEFTSTTVSATDEFTSTTVSATDEFTSTTVSATDEFTSTTVSATDEFTSTTVSATDEFTSTTVSATDEFTSTTVSATDEFTSTTVSATDEFTSTTVSATDEFTSTTVSATDEFTSTTVSATDEFTSTTVSATDEFTSTTVSATDEFTSTTVSATDEFTSTTVSATDEFTSTTVSATDEFTSTTQPTTDDFSSTTLSTTDDSAVSLTQPTSTTNDFQTSADDSITSTSHGDPSTLQTITDGLETSSTTTSDSTIPTSTSEDSTTPQATTNNSTTIDDTTMPPSVMNVTTDLPVFTTLLPTTDASTPLPTTSDSDVTTTSTKFLTSSPFATNDSTTVSTPEDTMPTSNELTSLPYTTDIPSTSGSTTDGIMSTTDEITTLPSTTDMPSTSVPTTSEQFRSTTADIDSTPFDDSITSSTTFASPIYEDDNMGIIIGLSVSLCVVVIVLICFCVYVTLRCERKHNEIENDRFITDDFPDQTSDKAKPPDQCIISNEDPKPVKEADDKSLLDSILISKYCQTIKPMFKSVKTQTDAKDKKKARNGFMKLKTQVFELSAIQKLPLVSTGSQTNQDVVMAALTSEKCFRETIIHRDDTKDAECQTETIDDEDIVVVKQMNTFGHTPIGDNRPESPMHWSNGKTEPSTVSLECRTKTSDHNKSGENTNSDISVTVYDDETSEYDFSVTTQTRRSEILEEKPRKNYSELIAEMEQIPQFETLNRVFEVHEISPTVRKEQRFRATHSFDDELKKPKGLKYRTSSVSPTPAHRNSLSGTTKDRYHSVYKNILDTLLEPGNTNAGMGKLNADTRESVNKTKSRTNQKKKEVETIIPSDVHAGKVKRQQLRRISPGPIFR